MRYERAVEIDAPVGHVFALLDDLDRHRLWLDGLEEVVSRSRRDPASPVGWRFTLKMRGPRKVEFDGELIAREKPSHLGLRIGNPAFTMDTHYRLAHAGAGTRLVYSVEVTNHTRATRVSSILLGSETRRLIRKQLRKLKKVAEQKTS